MPDDTQQQQAPPNLNAAIQALIQQQIAAASGQQQVQLPSLPAPQAQTQYSNDPSQGPDLLARIGLALGGGSLPGAPAELRQQMGKQALLNFGIGLMSAGRFASPGEVLAGGLRGAQGGLLGREAALAGQQEYALNAQTKMAELAGQQQKNRTEALTALVPLLQLQGRMGLPPLFGGGGGPGGGGGGGGPGSDTAFTGDPEHDLPIIAQRESGGDPKALNYVAKADPTAYDRGATASGKYQIVNSTWREGMQLAGLDPAQYATAMSAPEAVQDKVAQALYAKYGTRPWDASKFGANWVQQPGGGYQLVKGAPPPASGPGSAVGPYKVAGTGNVPPPTTQPSSGSGGAASPFGTGAFAPPTTTVAAPPDTTANAPNTGTALPVPTPAMTAALAEAKRTGKPAVIEGSGGATVGPDGKFSGNVTTGRRADADAILQGMQTAQTTLPPADTVTTAGPGAGGGGTPPAAQPAPDSAFGGGAFATAPPRFVGPVTAPAAPAQPPAPQPPAAPAQPPAQPAPPPTAVYPGDVQATPEQYMREHYQAATPEEVARYAPGPTGEAARNAAQKVQDAQQQLTAARTQLQQIRNGQIPGDPNKAMSDVQAAQNELDKNRSAYDEEVQKLAQSGAGNLLTRDNAEKTRVSQNYQRVQDREQQNQQQAATLANNIRLKEIELQNQLTVNREAVGNKVNQDTLTQAVKDQVDARNLAASVEGFQAMTGNVGQPGWLQTTKNPFGQGETIAEKLGQLGHPLTDTAGVQAMQAGINEMIKSLRAGMPMGSLSDRDLDFIRRMGPTEWMDPDTRTAVTSYILQAARAKQQFSYEIQKNLSKPGANAADAIQAADAKVKSFVSEVPFSSREWSDRSPEGTAKRMQWLQDHPLPPGTLYHLNDGSVMISKRPGPQQVVRPQQGPTVGYGNQ